jgi:NADPH:quinone reductase-like Zn-dependent oxidoreductase
MKAVMFEEHGGTEVLRYTDVEDPRPGPGEVVIRVEAVTVNPGPDVQTREGRFGVPGFSLPHVGGSDATGEVVELGEGVESVSVGRRVVVYPILSCGECDFCRRGVGENYCRNWRLWGVQTWGGRAEYAAIPAANLVPLPDTVSWEAASTLPISYITSWHGIVDRGALAEGDTVLVMGAAGGCGVAAIQIARVHGARTIAVSGEEWKRKRALELGAEIAIDYHDKDRADQVREATGGQGVTIAFDNVGESTWPQSLSCLDRAGRLVCSGTTTGPKIDFDARWAYRNMIGLHFYMCGSRSNLESLVDLIDEGRLDPVVDSSFPLQEIVKAEDKLATQDHFGKIVLTPRA